MCWERDIESCCFFKWEVYEELDRELNTYPSRYKKLLFYAYYFHIFRRTSQSYPRSGGKVERPKVPRFMQKNGHCNIRQAAQDKREKYMADFFTTFVDLDWLYSVGKCYAKFKISLRRLFKN